MAGPQADIDIDGKWTGSCTGEQIVPSIFAKVDEMTQRRIQQSMQAKEWSDYEITVEGERVQISVNGIVTVDNRFSNVPKSGLIGFQLHGGVPTEVAFKNLIMERKD